MSRSIKKQILNLITLPFAETPVAVTATLVMFALAFLPTNIKADVVTDWNEIADTVIVANEKRAPAAALVEMAYVHAAIYDTVNAIDHHYTTFAVNPGQVPAPDTSKNAAAATAAYKILLALFPAQETYLTIQYTNYLSVITEGKSKAQGLALGAEIAAKFLAFREGDGRDGEVPFLQGSGPGAWLPTMPDFTQPLVPWLAKMRPFMINSSSQFRAPGPPSLKSSQWRKDYNETKFFGDLNSGKRTSEQTEIGRFYAEHAGAQCSRVFRQFALETKLAVDDNARLFAMLYLAIADSVITGWESKYHYAFWRPVTAIRAGETASHNEISGDANWTPLVETPAHPEYPAAHGCVTAAYAETLRKFFGTKKVKISLSSQVTKTTRTFYNTDDIIKEIIDARIYGGMHYRTSGQDGVEIGKKVVDWMSRFQFRPIK